MKLCKEFLPISKEDLKKRKIDQLDFIIVSGDAYVDHLLWYCYYRQNS